MLELQDRRLLTTFEAPISLNPPLLTNFSTPVLTDSTQYPPLPYPSAVIVIVSLYNVLGVLFAFLGNGLVLISSVKYRAIDMDKTSMVLLQNLAVADFLIALLSWLPRTVSGLIGRWVLGKVVCFLAGLVVYIPALVELLILTVISSHKVYTLIYPLHTRQRHVTRATVVATVTTIWLLALSFLLICIVLLDQYPVYHPHTFSCTSTANTPSGETNAITVAFLVVALPALFTIIVANLALLSIVSRHNSKKYKDLPQNCKGDRMESSSMSGRVDPLESPQLKRRFQLQSRENSSSSLLVFSTGYTGKGKQCRQSPLTLGRESCAGFKKKPSHLIRQSSETGKCNGSILEDANTLRKMSRSTETMTIIRSPIPLRPKIKIRSPKSFKHTISRENLLSEMPTHYKLSNHKISKSNIVQDEEQASSSATGNDTGKASPVIAKDNLTVFIQRNPARLSPTTRDLSRSREVLNRITKKLSTNNFNVSKKAVLMVSGVSWLFILSIMPLIVQNLMTILHDNSLPDWFCLFQSEIYYLNVVCNPVIYTLHSNRFRTFMRRAVCFGLRRLRSRNVSGNSIAGGETVHGETEQTGTHDTITRNGGSSSTSARTSSRS